MITEDELKSARILVVDDNAASLGYTTAVLEASRYRNVTALQDPRQVMALHQRHAFDLIVLDMNMPELDGFAVLEALSACGDAYLSVLALTAEPEHKLRALEAGARDFLCKPCDPLELVTRVRNVLEVRLLYKRSCEFGQRATHYDALTGLPNRSLFHTMLAQALLAGTGQAQALVLLDIDGFALLNATLGWEAGDEVLREFGRRLEQFMPAGVQPARTGNDEFALLLPVPHTATDVRRMAEQLLAVCRQPVDIDGHGTRLTASAGIALLPQQPCEAGLVLGWASNALRQARSSGNGRYCLFTDAMSTEARQRFDCEHALRRACENGEFVLFYQPKVDLSTGRMTGAEALLRWQRPGHGMVSPAEFIPLLEETGLIVEAGAWVIDEACRQAAAWAKLAGRPLQIAVNVASRQFAEPGLQRVIEQALARHGLLPGMLALEVTESALMQDVQGTADTLAALRELGVRVAIDDFGTGYSSLAYLKRFPVDEIKIDMAFIRELTSSPGDAAIVDAVIAMAHSLHLEVVAEGVETAEQLAYLNRRHCDQIQGYYYSMPLPVEQFARLIASDVRLPPPAGQEMVAERTLLLIDDEPFVLASLERLLAQDGYRVLCAANAEQAFALLAAHPVQVVICDQCMEGMNGTELLARVKEMYPDTFRIILSGYTELGTILNAVNQGSLYRFFTKPWNNDVLRENVRAAFRHYWQMHGASARAAA